MMRDGSLTKRFVSVKYRKGEEVMRTSRTLHVLGVAALSLAVASSGGVGHPPRAASQTFFGGGNGAGAGSGAGPPRPRRGGAISDAVVPPPTSIMPGNILGE